MTILTIQEQLRLAISIAAEAHKNQFDKSGKPYILHPLHLMTQLLFDTQLATIAVLHDVTEDSSYSIDDLRSMGFSERVLVALSLLHHNKEDDYLLVYIPRIGGNYDSIRVKRKDLGHNSAITRLKGLTEKDFRRIEKYHTAYTMLAEYKRGFELRK